jgi:hypothetical protein
VSDFWAQRLGQQAPQQAPAAPQPAPSGPWWLPQQVAPAHPQPVQQQVVQTQQQVSVDPDGTTDIGTLLRQDGYTTTKAQSARDSESCPDCGGPNYLAEKGIPNSMKHCFDCGFNPRFSQSMAGMSSTGQNIPVKTARMQNITTGMPKMGTVVGHI